MAIQLYKLLFGGLIVDTMKDVFPLNSSLNNGTRNGYLFCNKPIIKICFGTESLSEKLGISF